MDSFDLSQCSIVIPCELDFYDRLEHLKFLLRYLTTYFKNHEVILVLYGDEIPSEYKPPAEIKIQHVKKEGPFSVTKISNYGAAFVTNPYFFKFDVDVLIHPRAIFETLEKLKSNPKLSFLQPYNGVAYHVLNPLRSEWLKSETHDFSKLPLVKPEDAFHATFPRMELKNNNSKGLVHLFRTPLFKQMGGYNEEFISWGYNEGEIIARFKTLGHPMERNDHFSCFHFRHRKIRGDPVLRQKNLELLGRVQQMPPEQLKTYIKTWSRFKKPL